MGLELYLRHRSGNVAMDGIDPGDSATNLTIDENNDYDLLLGNTPADGLLLLGEE